MRYITRFTSDGVGVSDGNAGATRTENKNCFGDARREVKVA